MFSKVVKHMFMTSIALTAMAVEGQNPTPRFISPDFSVEEERVAYPSDLLEFFKVPFINYLRQDTTKAKINGLGYANSSKGAAGALELTHRGIFAEIRGNQNYYGEGEIRKLYRSAEGWAGYADLIEEKIPFALKLSGHTSIFRGEYNPSNYNFHAGVEGHLPIAKNLLSVNLSAGRENWTQSIGFFPKVEPRDFDRSEIANSLSGEAVFRSMPGEYTGFEIFTGGVTSTRYLLGRWETVRTVTRGGGDLVYDSRPLRLAIGASLSRTWQMISISPKMNLEIVWRKFSAYATADGFIAPIERYETLPSLRAGIPSESDFIRYPLILEAGGVVELGLNHILHARAFYSRVENEPVLWNPLAEAPMASLEEARHQSFEVKLASRFLSITNYLIILLKRDMVGNVTIPIEPEELFADTVKLELGDFTIMAGGTRRYGQPYLQKPQETNISFGVNYIYNNADLTLSLENILGEQIFDERSLEFSDDVKLSAKISLGF